MTRPLLVDAAAQMDAHSFTITHLLMDAAVLTEDLGVSGVAASLQVNDGWKALDASVGGTLHGHTQNDFPWKNLPKELTRLGCCLVKYPDETLMPASKAVHNSTSLNVTHTEDLIPPITFVKRSASDNESITVDEDLYTSTGITASNWILSNVDSILHFDSNSVEPLCSLLSLPKASPAYLPHPLYLFQLLPTSWVTFTVSDYSFVSGNHFNLKLFRSHQLQSKSLMPSSTHFSLCDIMILQESSGALLSDMTVLLFGLDHIGCKVKMTQNNPDNPLSPHLNYMGLPDTFDYMAEQFGGRHRCAMPPAELTPSHLRSKLKATAQDVGLVKGASICRQAYQHATTMEDQDPVSAHSGAPNFTHMVPDNTSANATSSLTVPIASCHASLFPTSHAPAQIQDIFFGSVSQQHGWMNPHSSDTFIMMGAESFLPGGTQHHLITQDMSRLAPSPSFNFPDFSGEVTPFIPQPVPSLSSQGHAPPIPAMNVIPPMPFQNNATSSINTVGAGTVFHEHFPKEHELVTHQEGHTVTGRRSAELNAVLDVGFAAVECCFLDLSTSTTLPISQLINLFLKSHGHTMNGTNYWNLYANYFKEHMQMELACIGREAPAGGGMPSAIICTQCYDKFKEAYPDSYQDLLLMHEEALLLGSSTQTIAQHGQGFQKHY
ncbi:hypothetical protein BDR04DRAFT_1121379 [Suillus decipiens]|nr:hypothetical protein BDR04DRAFT_1121379 [Suillus decipiens]